MLTDVATFAGVYPFRRTAPSTVDWLLRHMARLQLDRAWVADPGACIARDLGSRNMRLVEELESQERLLPVPTAHLSSPWEEVLQFAVDVGAPAVRLYPQHEGVHEGASSLAEFGQAAAERRVPIVLTVRFEDARQRHPDDASCDLGGALIRYVARTHDDIRLLVSHASHDLIEEVHFGLTPLEAARVVWDVAWIWGPPEDHLARLWDTVGADRFVLGTGMPLRIPDATIAKVDLLSGGWEEHRQTFSANLARWGTP